MAEIQGVTAANIITNISIQVTMEEKLLKHFL